MLSETQLPQRAHTAEDAIAVLRENDRGSYNVPTKGLYPFQWNWDSCFTALGRWHFAAGYGPDAIVLGSPPHLPDSGFAIGAEDGSAGQSRGEFQRYVRSVELLARDAGTSYAPVNERMGAEGADALISPDHVHPNESGHSKIAKIFAAATPATDRFLK